MAYGQNGAITTPWYGEMTPLGEVWRIVALVGSLAAAWVVGHVVRWVGDSAAGSLERRGRRFTASTLQALARAALPFALAFGLQAGLALLTLEPAGRKATDTLVNLLFVLAVAYAAWRLVDVVDSWLTQAAARTPSKLDDMLAPIVSAGLRVTIVVLGLVEIATVLSDKRPSAIIAGLGVGGLAIGLAAQDTIKNFFGSIMIFSDRPFELGDRIQVDSFDGTVEAVGFRSTRVRTLDGHLVTIPNGDLASKSIRNLTKRTGIRRVMNLGLTYNTPPEKVREAIAIVEELLAGHEGQLPDQPPRIYFNEFQDSALNLSVTYWYQPDDWWAYNDFSQALNMQILKRFNAAGIEFAFPTQTVYLANGSQS
jgi:MscS family membrane protein